MHQQTRRPGRQKGDKPSPIDVHVGSRVRLRRNMLGLSQEKLGGAIGLTFQQVQKYERGANRIGASRLHDLSQVLDVPVSFFFDDMDPVRAPAIPAGFAEPAAEAFDADPLRRRETVELVSAYYRIDDPALRRRLFELARALAVGADNGRRQNRSSTLEPAIFSARLSRVEAERRPLRPRAAEFIAEPGLLPEGRRFEPSVSCRIDDDFQTALFASTALGWKDGASRRTRFRRCAALRCDDRLWRPCRGAQV